MAEFGSYRAIGLPWIRQEDYPAYLAIIEDRSYSAPTWEEWSKRAEEAEKDFEAQGLIVERVYIDPDTFPSWCKANGHRVNSDATVKFTLAVTLQKYGSTHYPGFGIDWRASRVIQLSLPHAGRVT